MVQPKTPPLSLRVPAAMMAAVDEWAAKYQCSRHAALISLIGLGLGDTRQPSERRAFQPEHDALVKIAAGPTIKDGDITKIGDGPPMRVSVPLAGTFERRPYQKGAKK